MQFRQGELSIIRKTNTQTAALTQINDPRFGHDQVQRLVRWL